MLSQAVIALWDSLEAFVHDFIAEWLRQIPEARNKEEVQRIKISLSEYEDLTDDERYHYVVQKLSQSSPSENACGTERFERLLSMFGLDGQLEPDDTRNLCELHQVRNNLVHRRGIADTTLLRRCRWMGAEPGKRLSLTSNDFNRYMLAARAYVRSVEQRVRRRFDLQAVQ